MRLLSPPRFLVAPGPCIQLTLAHLHLIAGQVDPELLRDVEDKAQEDPAGDADLLRLLQRALDIVDAAETRTSAKTLAWGPEASPQPALAVQSRIRRQSVVRSDALRRVLTSH